MVQRASIPVTLLLVAAALPVAAAGTGTQAKEPDVSATVRGMIEPSYRKNTGLAFKSFVCPAGRPAGGFLDCDAVDEEGDALRYTLEVDEEGDAKVVLVSQPASGVTSRDKSALEPPCRAFLKGYAAGDWDDVYATFAPELRQTLTREQMKALLEPMRASLGAVGSAELTSYSRRVPDQHELQYTLSCARGRGMARFRVDPEAGKITAFMVNAEPGSPLQAALLEPTLRSMLSGFIGKPVERLEARIDRLARIGDAVEATAHLAGGRQVPVRVVQTGRPDDFDPMDFTAEVLDAALLIQRFVSGRGGPAVESVDCPARVVEDGGSQTCRVSLAGGKRIAITLGRRGGEHRVLAEKPIEP
jgi:hypothetical protein